MVIYIPIAILGRAFYEKREVFPLFAWSLYSKTPSDRVRTFIQVTELNGEKLSSPINIYDKLKLSKRPGFDIRAIMIRWEKAFKSKNQAQLEILKAEIKNVYLKDNVTSFRIATEKYNPFERLKTGKIESTTPQTQEISN